MAQQMSDAEISFRAQCRRDFLYYAPRVLRIKAKNGKILPFGLNRAQLHIHQRVETQRAEHGWVRAMLLKGRQQGASTYVAGRYYWRVTHEFGYRAYILTHEAEATDNLFGMAKRYHELAPDIMRPRVGSDSTRELSFPGLGDAGYKVGTAGNKGAGRSSTIQLFHGSEVAFWPHAAEHAKGVLQAVPEEPGTEVILESTANGVGGYYHEQWQLAEVGGSDFQAIFVPWFWQREYSRPVEPGFVIDAEEAELIRMWGLTAEQIYWRRLRITQLSANGQDGLANFRQEYPMTATEAFQTSGGELALIHPGPVLLARKPLNPVQGSGALLMGVDPARFGDDRTSIIFRQGRKAWGLVSFSKLDTMQIVGIIVVALREQRPDRVFIDVVGLGAGVVDRLRELGYGDRIVAVNGGEKPMDYERYLNKRAEMWGEMKAWFTDPAMPVQIPDSDTLQADICSPWHSFDSNGRMQLEKKEDMKKRGLRSPDEADALANTFASPGAQHETYQPETEHLENY